MIGLHNCFLFNQILNKYNGDHINSYSVGICKNQDVRIENNASEIIVYTIFAIMVQEMVSLKFETCINSLRPSDAYMRR